MRSGGLSAVVAGCALAVVLPLAAVLPGDAADVRVVAAAAFPGENDRIAFVSSRDGGDELYTMAGDGSDPVRLTESPGSERTPAWSPDGTRLAFALETGSGRNELYVVDRDGTDARRVADEETDGSEPAWSPDGERILFESERDGGRSQLWVIDTDGTALDLVVEAPDDGAVTDPTWSPDGRRIAYAAVVDPGGSSTIWVANADGTGRRQVTDPDGNDHRHPDWSPDGRRLVYSSDDPDGSVIVTIRADGSDRAQLTDPPENDDRPSWSPDGTAITFERTVVAGTSSSTTVWRMDSDGEDEEQLSAAGLEDDVEPAWGPVPPVATVVVEPPAAAHDVGDEATVRITATDGLGDPVPGADLVLRITGAHPRTVRLTTGADGGATSTWESTRAGTDTVLVCADPDGDGACDPADPADTAAVVWSVPAVDEPRLAFTDDTDALATLTVERVRPELLPMFYRQASAAASYQNPVAGLARGPTHEGEAAGTPGSPPAFVSTRDDPAGEVYLAQIRSQPPLRVTCDPGTETHPVVSRGGAVAYASDADGDWDVYVSTPPPPPGPDRPAPFGRSAVPSRPVSGAAALATACDEEWTTVNVTDEPAGAPTADDLWPTWTYDASGGVFAGTDGVAFSRAYEGELPDLWRAAGPGPVYAPPVPLTTTPDVAETEPAGMALQVQTNPGCEGFACPVHAGRSWLAFTTTARRASGTVALLAVDDPTRVLAPAAPGFQGGEPAWSDAVNPTHLAIATTENDPYGDLAIAEVADPVLTGGAPSDPVVGEFGLVFQGVSGTAETHPHWLSGFGSEDDEAVLVVTTRSEEVESGGRVLDADVSDVRALDGTQRRVIRRQRVIEDGAVTFRFDEAGPAYSPDGRRLVHSRDTWRGDGRFGARLLVVADADGANAAPLLPPALRVSDADLDVDPVWSPDGTRIAFVRVAGRDRVEAPSDPPQVYVYDIPAGTTTRVRAGDGTSIDTSPSWAPDSRHLVLARSAPGSGGTGDPRDAARRWEYSPAGRDTVLVVADADRPLEPAVGFDSCDDGCAVRGRSPAWSPDGTTIAYDDDGQLRTVTLDGPCCASGATIATAPPVTLVGAERSTGELTPSRAVVESAQDPAWSPDGSELAFTGQPVGQPDHRGIWRIGADGADVRVFTDEPGPESEPAWQDRRDTDVAVTVTIAGSPALVGEPVIATFTVTNNGPRPAPLVTLATTFSPGAVTAATPSAPAGCRVDGSGCDLGLLAPGDTRTYRVRVRHPAKVLGTATGTVGADAPDPVPANDVDSAPYRVMGTDVAVRIGIDRPVGYVGGTRTAVVTVRNAGVDPVEDVTVRATWAPALTPAVPPALPPPAPPPAPACLVAGVSCPLGTLAPGARRRFRVELGTTTADVVVVAAEVSTSTPELDVSNNADEAQVEVLQPTLRLLPAVAPPGKVVLAYGEDMPPRSRVTLTWVRGITNHVGPFRVADDGTLRMPVLVIRHDLMGERELEAASSTALFSPVRGVLLVVPRTLAPPSFNGRG